MTKYSIWLMPEEKASSEMQAIINQYSSELEYVPFKPHLTLLGAVESNQDTLLEILENVLSKTSQLQISISEVSISTTYFQSVFARVEPKPDLLDLQIELQRKIAPSITSFFMPHISLLYADITSKEKWQIAKDIYLEHRQFFVDQIAVMTADSSNPKDWQEVAHFQLT